MCKRVKTIKVLLKRNSMSKKIRRSKMIEEKNNIQISHKHVEYHLDTEENVSFLTEDILHQLKNTRSRKCLNYKKSLKSVIEEAKKELDENYFNTNIYGYNSEDYVDYDNILFCQESFSDNCESDYIEMK